MKTIKVAKVETEIVRVKEMMKKKM